ncbi:hypothetical protein PsYK624_086090 [Phanerochaete sordida]|uniref:Uncharacterized protein n=1 Tax=Phanerochaete sordida TaxID=48140 RepID=A0A9P3LEP1_9APHY|nr:hypothetical protein PsYK624_086090 [Phanerochaete sordida]
MPWLPLIKPGARTHVSDALESQCHHVVRPHFQQVPGHTRKLQSSPLSSHRGPRTDACIGLRCTRGHGYRSFRAIVPLIRPASVGNRTIALGIFQGALVIPQARGSTCGAAGVVRHVCHRYCCSCPHWTVLDTL